jgi:UDP-N-acetyl-D-mannosaminuronic acid dehydrogenase
MTGHDCYRSLNPAHVKGLTGREHPAIIDGRNLIDPDRFIAMGFVYKGIGRGDKNNHTMVTKDTKATKYASVPAIPLSN